MKTDRDDDLMDRVIQAIVERPFPDAPPETVRQRVLALGDGESAPTLTNRGPAEPFIIQCVRLIAVAAALLVAVDLGWWLCVHTTTPVCWFRKSEAGTWHVMYSDTRVEISDSPQHVRGES